MDNLQKFFKLLSLIYEKELQIIKELDMTLLEYYTLQILSFSQTVTPKQIAIKLSLPKSSVTYIIDSLESRGFLKRNLDKADRRSWLLSLTQLGRQMLNRIFARKSELLVPQFGTISEDEGEYWTRLMDELIRSFQSDENGGKR